MHPTRRLLLALGLVAAPATAAAAPADVRYYLTHPDGSFDREMDENDRELFLNRARCECGQPIHTRVAVTDELPAGPTQTVEYLLGPICDVTEIGPLGPLGQFRPCARLAAQLPGNPPVDASFHPVLLTNGVALTSVDHRDPADPDIVAAGGCNGYAGASGTWLCVPLLDGVAGCQRDDFVVAPDSPGSPFLWFDFQEPIGTPPSITVEPRSGGAVVHVEADAFGELVGYRILCAETETGKPPEGLDFPAPAPNETSDGTTFFTARNLCGGAPFSSIELDPYPYVEPPRCGDGKLDSGETCDDGDDNGDEGLCSSRCELLVSASLYALDWAHVCSDHVDSSGGSTTIAGLKNDTTYNLVVVAYDRAGNPRATPRVFYVAPSSVLPPLEPDGCDCRVADDAGPGGGPWILAGLGLAAYRRRRAR